MTTETRAAMTKAAIKVAQAIGYRGLVQLNLLWMAETGCGQTGFGL